MPFTGQCNNTEKVPVTVKGRTKPDAAGNARPAEFENFTVDVLSGDGTANLTGPSSFEAVSGTAVGDTVIHMRADGIVGAGEGIIEDTYTLTVVGENADQLDVVSGAPVPK